MALFRRRGTQTSQLASLYFNQFPSYCQMITDAKKRARRSLLIDHCGLDHIDLNTGFSNIERVYSIHKESRRGLTKLSLIEFQTEDDADKVAKQAEHSEGLLPVALKILRCKAYTSSSPLQKPIFPIEKVKLSYRQELHPNFKTYVDLVSNNMMSLVALKLRFITLVNFERILCSGMFDQYELMPFGSSVTDIGSDSGDLDLVVTRKEDHHQIIEDSLSNSRKICNSGLTHKLVHLDKSLYHETKDRSGVKGIMNWFDHILREYMPLTDGYSVLSVRHAKVPIIKFTSLITSIDCDLSFNLGLDHREQSILTTNYSGILMSQILYSLCRHNNLFTATAVYLRLFGKLTSITSKEPNAGFTNFQLLSMIIFYLQQVTITSRQRCQDRKVPGDDYEIKLNTARKQPSILPPFNDLLVSNFSYEAASINLTDEQLNCLLPDVIQGFFEFYSDFDFTGCSLNLYKAKLERKLDNSSLYVLNPLDRSRNICHNVSRKGLEHFLKQIRLALTGLRNSTYESPLDLMKALLARQIEQTKKTRLILDGMDQDHYQEGGRLVVTTEGIAQDVCR